MRQRELHSFVAYLKETDQFDIAVKDLKPYHVSEWLERRPARGHSSRRISISSLLAALNWAKDEGYIDANPIDGRVKQPAPVSRGREAVIDKSTYQEWHGFCDHESFNNIIYIYSVQARSPAWGSCRAPASTRNMGRGPSAARGLPRIPPGFGSSTCPRSHRPIPTS